MISRAIDIIFTELTKIDLTESYWKYSPEILRTKLPYNIFPMFVSFWHNYNKTDIWNFSRRKFDFKPQKHMHVEISRKLVCATH